MSSFPRRIAGGIALAVAALAAPASAQTFRVVPQVGLFANAQDLPDFDPGFFLEDGSNRSAKLALGLAVEARLPGLPLAVRLGGVYGTESDVPVQGVVCIESPCTSALASTLAVAADLVVEMPSPELLRPYLLAGVGFKRWSVNREVGIGSFLENETRLAGHLGAGVGVDLGPVGLVLEVTDYLTGGAGGGDSGARLGDADLRHDVFVMMGLSMSR